MSNIVQARAELRKLAAILRQIDHPSLGAGIENICETLLTRRPHLRQAPRKAKRLTKPVKYAILDLCKRYPDMPTAEIGRLCGVSGGRVSEVIHGLR
jgi:hypothetical protein